jgi:putative tricarboxylic transport membrane protein
MYLLCAPTTAAESIHFLIPGGAGGGWDATARGVGMVLRQSGLIESASFENVSGAGGGRAIATLIESAARRQNVMMVNSTPIIVRSLGGAFPFSYRDLTPIARGIGDYQTLVVRPDSDLRNFSDVLERFREDPRLVKIAGGSVRGDLDHLAPALMFKAAGEDARKLIYVPYDAGGRAIAGFLTGEADILSTGFGEALAYHRSGKLRIIVVSSSKRLAVAPDVTTLIEDGVELEFVNWRGFFAAPGIPDNFADRWSQLFVDMQATEEWRELRDRNGWQDQYLERGEFRNFLENQEHELRELMIELGFYRDDDR